LVFAPPRRQRRVFCIDNVSSLVHIQDMKEFLSNVGITIVDLSVC
jgi:hypothetical protein